MESKDPCLGHQVAKRSLQRGYLVRATKRLGIGGNLEEIFDLAHCGSNLGIHLLCKLKLVTTAVDFVHNLTIQINET